MRNSFTMLVAGSFIHTAQAVHTEGCDKALFDR